MTANRLLAEFIGTAFLLIGVVGSGIMGAALADGNVAIALLANAIATGCVLFVAISVFGPISGAHFNPAVTFVFGLRGEIGRGLALAYMAVQVAGGIVGVWLAHAMSDLQILQLSTTARSGAGLWLSEILATFGLLMVILGGVRHAPDTVAALVAIYITGAYWFSSSTSFANPAVTIARGLSDTFAGIQAGHAPMFIAMQILGALLAFRVAGRLFR